MKPNNNCGVLASEKPFNMKQQTVSGILNPANGKQQLSPSDVEQKASISVKWKKTGI